MSIVCPRVIRGNRGDIASRYGILQTLVNCGATVSAVFAARDIHVPEPLRAKIVPYGPVYNFWPRLRGLRLLMRSRTVVWTGGLDLQEGKANYLIGNDPSNWQTDVPLFGRVVYRDLYPGIDMFYSSSTRRLKSEFVVAPGADPSRIQIAYKGVAGIRIDEAGGLIVSTGLAAD